MGIPKAILHEQCEELYEKRYLPCGSLRPVPVAALRKTESIGCGNEYTNNATQAKERGCKVGGGRNVTVIQGSRPSGGGALRPVVGRLPRLHRHRPVCLPAGAIRGDQQRPARPRLGCPCDLELNCAKPKPAMPSWSKEYNGRPARTQCAGFAQTQRYMERTAELKETVARSETCDIAGIKRAEPFACQLILTQ